MNIFKLIKIFFHLIYLKKKKFKASSPDSLSGEIIIHFQVSTKRVGQKFYKNLYDECENNLKLEDDI